MEEVQAHRTSSNLLELHPQAHRTSANLLDLPSHRDSKVERLLSHEVGMVRLDRTLSNAISSRDTRCVGSTALQGIQGVQGALCTGSGRFNQIEPQRTFALRTSSNLLYLHPHRASWMRFEHVEPLRTFLNGLLTAIARCDVFHSRSGWFYCTEPPQTTFV